MSQPSPPRHPSIRERLGEPADRLRLAMVRRTIELFAEAGDPMAKTLEYPDDPGLFGPDSLTWEIMGDAAGIVGGIRALLIQAAHPEVVAGVRDHSSYRADPLGRLSRTSNYVFATSYGAMPEVEQAVRVVRAAHRRVEGTSHRGIAYAADDPELSAWVHNSMTDSFLECARAYGPRPLTQVERDGFVREQARIGRLLDADPVPETAGELSRWVAEHPMVGASPGMHEAVEFLREPPLDPAVKVAYQVLAAAAIATIPPRIRRALGLKPRPGALGVGRVSVGALRWVLGSSPRWRLALLRTGAPVVEGRFKQKTPFDSLADHRGSLSGG